MSGIVCLTEWHKHKIAETYPEVANITKVIGNGISTNNFVNVNEKHENSFIYTSHAERGLQTILDEWSEIQNKLPNAVLNISTPEYGLEFFKEKFLERVRQWIMSNFMEHCQLKNYIN